MASGARDPIYLNDLVRTVCTRMRKSNLTNFPDVSPILTPGAVNNIMVYPGAFNPAHLGHLEILNLAKAPWFNCVAAFILPISDDYVARKAAAYEFTFKMPAEIRQKAWEEEMKGDDWCYVWKSRGRTFKEFMMSLSSEAKKVGVELRMYEVYGSDCFYGEETVEEYGYHCGVVYVERTLDAPDGMNIYDSVTGVPLRIQEHSAWEEVSLETIGNSVLRSEGPTAGAVDPNFERIWMCKSDLDENNASFFIKRQPGTPAILNGREIISSTVIRNSIEDFQAGGDADALRAALDGLVIGVDILLEYLTKIRITKERVA